MKKLFLLLLPLLFHCACHNTSSPDTISPLSINRAAYEKAFNTQMEKHLNAITNKDLETLQSTMHPGGKMQLILPDQEIMMSVDSFMQFHIDWFIGGEWTFTTEILNTEVGDRIGMAIVEAIYREPDRDGKPYFNRMMVSYTLELLDDQWYIIKDHASSSEKGEIYTK